MPRSALTLESRGRAAGRRQAEGIQPRPHVVIVGAGFAGLDCARQLAGGAVSVTVVDRNNHHTFQPLLYQVATSGLGPPDVAYPVRGILRRFPNVAFRQAEVEDVDWDGRVLRLDEGRTLGFDYLVMAAGAQTGWFGVPGADEHALPLYQLSDAIGVRNHVLEQFEEASWEHDGGRLPAGRLTFVIVGGGPTGVEMAGALQELIDHVLVKDFPDLDTSASEIVLVEMGDAVLESFSPNAQRHAADDLRRRGIDVRLGTKVAEVASDEVVLSSGERIPTRTVIWAAGVRANALADAMGVAQTQGGRIVVDARLSIPGRPGAFAVGDIAAAEDGDGHVLPQLAPVAKQSGEFVGRAILDEVADRRPTHFRFHDRGTMATIGRNSAVADLPFGIKLSGRVAWLAWLFLHLLFLAGFRNRLSVLVDWSWSFLTHERAPRVIVTWPEPRR